MMITLGHVSLIFPTQACTRTTAHASTYIPDQLGSVLLRQRLVLYAKNSVLTQYYHPRHYRAFQRDILALRGKASLHQKQA
jgi:hypothetical protein